MEGIKNENIVKLLAEKIIPIEKAPEEWTNGVLIKVDNQNASVGMLEKLKPIIENFPGDCTACLKIVIDDKPPVLVKLSDEYMTDSSPSFFDRVEDLLGKGAIETRCAAVKEKERKKKPWLNKKKTS